MATGVNGNAPFAPDRKRQAVSDLCDRQGSSLKIAKRVGVSRPMSYKWKDHILGDKAYRSMHKRKVNAPGDEQSALLERANELIRKDQGIDF